MVFDSNLVIYARLPEHERLAAFMETVPIEVSVASKIEVIGYHKLSPEALTSLSVFFDNVTVHELNDVIVDEAIRLRQQRKMSLGDAIIAGTALVFGSSLATHNAKDFAWIDGLDVVDPLAA